MAGNIYANESSCQYGNGLLIAPAYPVAQHHRIPLKCGGADKIGNLQWLIIHDHKARTRREARWCRR